MCDFVPMRGDNAADNLRIFAGIAYNTELTQQNRAIRRNWNKNEVYR
jgi:hypothetical protein